MSGGLAKDSGNGASNGWLSRERVVALVLTVASAGVFYLCYRLILPFLPALAWALALAVVAHPLHRRLKAWIPYPNVAAGLSVVLVALMIVAPVVFLTHSLLYEADKYTQTIQDHLISGKWRVALEKNPRLKKIVPWLESQLGFRSAATTGAPTLMEESSTDEEKPTPPPVPAAETPPASVLEGVSAMVTGTIWLGMQLFVTLLTLFFFFRDRHLALGALRSLLPLQNSEIDEVFTRVSDTIHYTLYGSLVVAAVQGAMGGLIFWWLGIPGPLMWGAVMGLLAVVPVLGTFVVWGL
jgi:predicted PurR-regulated permease PerM